MAGLAIKCTAKWVMCRCYRAHLQKSVRQQLPRPAHNSLGWASSTAKVLRHIFAGPSHGADAGMANRLTQTVLRAMRGAEKADFDLRDLHQATLSELEGFQFNKLSPLHEVLAVQADLSISEGGSVKVNLPAIEKDALYFLSTAATVSCVCWW